MREMKARAEFVSPRIESVRPGDGDYVLDVTWENGSETRVDLAEIVFRLKHFRPLRKVEQFKQAKVGEWGWSIAWDSDLELSGELIWEKAEEQKNAVMTASDFRAWLEKWKLTHERAASLLGVSKRSVAYYATGAMPVTRVLALALKGLESEIGAKAPSPFQAALMTAMAVLTDEAMGTTKIAEPVYEQIASLLETRQSLFDHLTKAEREVLGDLSKDWARPTGISSRFHGWQESYVSLLYEGARHSMLRSLLSATQSMEADEFDHALGAVVSLVPIAEPSVQWSAPWAEHLPELANTISKKKRTRSHRYRRKSSASD